MPKLIANNSCSIVDLLRSPFLNDLDANPIGKSIPSYVWERTAPIPSRDASTVTMNWRLKSGYCRMGGLESASVNLTKED